MPEPPSRVLGSRRTRSTRRTCRRETMLVIRRKVVNNGPRLGRPVAARAPQRCGACPRAAGVVAPGSAHVDGGVVDHEGGLLLVVLRAGELQRDGLPGV